MTLIYCVMNEENAVLVADRRRSFGRGRRPDDESCKALVINLANARMAVAFTGLASVPAFANRPAFYTRRWLADALIDAAAANPLLQPTMSRFREIASRDIQQVQVPARTDPSAKCLTVVAAGYEYSENDARPSYFRISNFEGENPTSNRQRHPKDNFDMMWERAQRPSAPKTEMVTASGWTDGIPVDSIQQLATLASQGRPPSMWIDKAVALIRVAAESPLSERSIGRQCTSVLLPADLTKWAQGGYHSARLTTREYAPGYIEARGGAANFIIMDAEFGMQDAAGTDQVVQVPKVGRNKPCPCGSGRKYKHCHGRPGTAEWQATFGG